MQRCTGKYEKEDKCLVPRSVGSAESESVCALDVTRVPGG